MKMAGLPKEELKVARFFYVKGGKQDGWVLEYLTYRVVRPLFLGEGR